MGRTQVSIGGRVPAAHVGVKARQVEELGGQSFQELIRAGGVNTLLGLWWG